VFRAAKNSNVALKEQPTRFRFSLLLTSFFQGSNLTRSYGTVRLLLPLHLHNDFTITEATIN